MKYIGIRKLIIGIFILLTGSSFGQSKYSYINFNKLTEIVGTDYVIATIEDLGKIQVNSKYLLFINSRTGAANQVDLPKDSYIERMDQIKIDSLGINKIVLSAKTVNLNEKSGIDWYDPKQLCVLTTDGNEKVQLTQDNFFTGTWIVNKKTGAIVITGHYDSNNNKRFDKEDKNEILIFDLRTNKLIAKL